MVEVLVSELLSEKAESRACEEILVLSVNVTCFIVILIDFDKKIISLPFLFS